MGIGLNSRMIVTPSKNENPGRRPPPIPNVKKGVAFTFGKPRYLTICDLRRARCQQFQVRLRLSMYKLVSGESSME